MATPPTLIDEAEGTWSHTGTSETIAGIDTGAASGRALAILAASADSPQTISSPTGGSLTYTLQQSNVIGSNSNTYMWTAIPSTNQTFSLGLTGSSNGNPWSANVLAWSGSDGIGASGKNNGTGGPTLTFTTLHDNSAIAVIVADWNAVSGASRTWRTVNGITPTSGNGLEKTYFTDGSNYTVYGAIYNDAGTAGSKTVGLSAPTGQKYTIIAVEIRGTAAGGTTHSAEASLTGTATISPTAATDKPVSAATTATAAVSTAASATKPVSATTTATATITAAASVVKPVSASLSVTATISPDASIGSATHTASATVTETATITADAATTKPVSTAVTETATIDSTASVTKPASASIDTTATITASASVVKPISAAMSVTASVATAADTGTAGNFVCQDFTTTVVAVSYSATVVTEVHSATATPVTYSTASSVEEHSATVTICGR